MPREQVIGEGGPFDVAIGWSADTVQVGVTTSDGRSLVTLLYGDPQARIRIAEAVCHRLGVPAPTADDSVMQAEWRAALGRELLDIVEANSDGGISYTSVHATFTRRQGVNDLIRFLRRARDVAFGKDQ